MRQGEGGTLQILEASDVEFQTEGCGGSGGF